MNGGVEVEKEKGFVLCSLDQIGSEWATLVEDKSGKMIKVSIVDLPENIKEGDMLIYHNGMYLFAPKETEARREEIRQKLKRLLDKLE